MLEMREAIDSGAVRPLRQPPRSQGALSSRSMEPASATQAQGGYGATLVNETTGAEKVVTGRDPATTNNQMKLSAAIAGLNALRPAAVVTMLGDSQNVIKGITEWMPG